MDLTTSSTPRLGLALAGALLLALVLSAAWFLLGPLRDLGDRLGYLREQRIAPALALRDARADLNELRAYELAQIGHASDPAELADYDKRAADAITRLGSAWKRYEASHPAGDEARRMATLKAGLDRYTRLHARIREAIQAGDGALARSLSTQQAMPLRRTLASDLAALTARTDQHRVLSAD